LQNLCPDALAELHGETWYAADSPLPVLAAPEIFTAAGARFAEVCAANGVAWGLVRSVVVCPARFNRLLDHWGSKRAVLGHGLAELLRHTRGLAGDEPLCFFIDKHGGRNTYSAMLQEAFPDGLVIARQEGMACSSYQVLGL